MSKCGRIFVESVNAVTLGRKFYRKYGKMILIQKGLTISLGILFFDIFGPEGILFGLVLTFIPPCVELVFDDFSVASVQSRKLFRLKKLN